MIKPKFLTELVVSGGDGTWKVEQELKYQSGIMDMVLTVPAGFATDFASVPKVPIVYEAFGDRAHRESVIHDYLYYVAICPKEMADKVFLEAMKARGKAFWIRWGMYIGVKFGGQKAWDSHRKLGHSLTEFKF